MRKIRKGKDIAVSWPILTNGEPAPLDGRDLVVEVKSKYYVKEIRPDIIRGNVVQFIFHGIDQPMLGPYTLTLWENYGKEQQTAVDYCDAFELVSCTCKEENGSDNGLTTETLDLKSSILKVGIESGIGIPEGGSAGQILGKKTDNDYDVEWQNIPIVQESGESTTDIMSQDAVTRELKQIVKNSDDRANEINASIDELKAEDERLDGLITAETARSTGEEASIRSDMEAGDAATLQSAKADAGQQIALHNTSETSHADIRTLLATRVGLPTFDAQAYTLTFTAQNGATVVVDFPLETMGLDYDAETKEMIYTNADGSKRRIPLTEFVDIYVGSVGSEIQIAVDEGNIIRATLLNGAVSWAKLSADLQARIDGKVDKVAGKGLSTEDYTAAEKQKLAGIEAGANNYELPDTLPATMIEQDATHRFVSDDEKTKYVTTDTDQTISGKKIFTGKIAIVNGLTENKSMPFFLGIDGFNDGGEVHWIEKGSVPAAIDVYKKSETISSASIRTIAGPMTATQYAALTPDANTIYIITD